MHDVLGAVEIQQHSAFSASFTGRNCNLWLSMDNVLLLFDGCTNRKLTLVAAHELPHAPRVPPRTSGPPSARGKYSSEHVVAADEVVIERCADVR